MTGRAGRAAGRSGRGFEEARAGPRGARAREPRPACTVALARRSLGCRDRAAPPRAAHQAVVAVLVFVARVAVLAARASSPDTRELLRAIHLTRTRGPAPSANHATWIGAASIAERAFLAGVPDEGQRARLPNRHGLEARPGRRAVQAFLAGGAGLAALAERSGRNTGAGAEREIAPRGSSALDAEHACVSGLGETRQRLTATVHEQRRADRARALGLADRLDAPPGRLPIVRERAPIQRLLELPHDGATPNRIEPSLAGRAIESSDEQATRGRAIALDTRELRAEARERDGWPARDLVCAGDEGERGEAPHPARSGTARPIAANTAFRSSQTRRLSAGFRNK